MSRGEQNKKIAKNTMALYIRMGITMIISFFTTRITLEVLGSEDYGLNNVVASVVSLFGFINGSMGTAVQRFFSIEIGKENEQDLGRVFGTAIYLHIIVAAITLIISEVFAIFFLHKLNIPLERMFAAKVVFQISTASLILGIINVPYNALLRAREEFSKIAIIDIIQALLRLSVLYLLYIVNYDKLILLSSLYFGITLFYFFSIKIIANKYEEAKFKILRDKEYISKMVGFTSMLIFTVLVSVGNKQGIVILVNIFFGLTINAAYAIAFQVSGIIETFAMNFKQSVVPQLMAAYGANDINRMHNLMTIGTKLTFLLMMIISFPVIFEIDFILNLWLKSPPQYASQFIVLLIIMANIDVFSYFLYQAVHASGKIKGQQMLISLSHISSIILVFISFKLGADFYYAVYIPIFFAIIRNVITIYYAWKTINFSITKYFKKVILPSFTTVCILIAPNLIITTHVEESLLRVFIILASNSILMILLGYLLLLDNAEKSNIKKLIKLKI